MRELVMHAGPWRTADDFYDSFFSAVGAPSWHGRNFNALRDSIGGGQINEVELPYRIIIRGLACASTNAREIAMSFEDLVRGLAREGCRVEIELES
jgi:RNAse (barnase) inhibitor barstar